MKAQEVLDIALAILDERPDDQAEPLYLYVEIINVVQREIAKAEGVVPSDILTLDDDLSISDDAAGLVMPYGLAARFAVIDGNREAYADALSNYNTLLRSLPAVESETIDVMGSTL